MKSKDGGGGRRAQAQSRNLYKVGRLARSDLRPSASLLVWAEQFLKVEEWFVTESAAFRHGL